MSSDGRARCALILAAGAGKRMRAGGGAGLTGEQAEAAERGQKAFMPVGGRPLILHQIDRLERAGISDVCVVISPETGEDWPFHQVVQPDPQGTADAVFRAEPWIAGRNFLVLNGDNLYPVEALESVASTDAPSVAGFDRDDLVATSNIPAERIAAFAVLEADSRGYLRRIIEKPAPDEIAAIAPPIMVGMNLWKFDPRIFEACLDVEPSPRGELELPSAVMLAMSRGSEFRVIPSRGPVLDLSGRGDIAEVARRLGGAA